MWAILSTDEFAKMARLYEKRHPRELRAVLDNLDTYFKSLEAGIKPLQIKHGFIHPEPHGVVAIDQKGGGKSLKATRLYVFPDVETETLLVITLGDKGTQKDNIATCREYILNLREERQNDQGKASDDPGQKEDPEEPKAE